jgi:hypothetical protein
MKKIPEEIIQDWVKNKKRISDRINRINKRLKKYEKQKNHFQFRMKLIQQYEKEARNQNSVPSQSIPNGSVRKDGEASVDKD